MVVHLTNWVIGHSHLAFVASYSFWAFALVYLIVPELTGGGVYRRNWMEWHYWLTTLGMLIFMVSMWVAGLIQGQNWSTYSVPFLQTVITMKPYFGARLLGGAMAGIGILCFAWSIWQGAREVNREA
jgi:cytochrome c oxidase cbb3-type subunit 1